MVGFARKTGPFPELSLCAVKEISGLLGIGPHGSLKRPPVNYSGVWLSPEVDRCPVSII